MPLGQLGDVRLCFAKASAISVKQKTAIAKTHSQTRIICLIGAGDERVTDTTTGPVTRRLDTTRKREAHDHKPMRVAMGKREMGVCVCV